MIRFTDDTKRKIRAAAALRANNMTLAAIGEELGCTASYVRRLLKLPRFGLVEQETCADTFGSDPIANDGASN